MSLQLNRVIFRSFKYSASTCKSNVSYAEHACRPFSESAECQTRQRKSMWTWITTQGQKFKDPLPESTNYLGAYDFEGKPVSEIKGTELVPFPQNRAFRSERVVNEVMREDIWAKVMKDGLSVRTVSAQLGVEMNRVGAIVRLKEIEKQWIQRGKRLAKPYAKAVMAMLPKTHYPSNKGRYTQPHESINDLPVHAATMQQIFYPTSESREFTRIDAARIFNEKLLPADQRVPHPELAELEKDRLAGMPLVERVAKAAIRNEEAELRKAAADQRRKEWQEKSMKVVSGSRWDFKFQEINVEDAGRDGRGYKGTGWRYGAPHMDRRKGEVKIPTRVE